MREELYQQLVQQHSAALYAYFAGNWRFSRAECEDLMQEAYLEAWRGLEGYRQEGSLLAWAFTICRRLAWRHVKSRPQMASLDAEDADPAWLKEEGACLKGELEYRSESRFLWKMLERLNEHDQEILYLHYYQSLTEKQIAQILDVNEHTLHTRLNNARRKLRELCRRNYR